MRWHMRAGTLLLALVLFRVLWGLVGSSTARFARFVKGPVAVAKYLGSIRSKTAPIVGHNPAGGWSVIILLALLLAQTTTGLFAGDPFDGATGPLNDKVGVMRAGAMTDWHEMAFNIILGFVALHLLAIAFYRIVLKEKLVKPMVTGTSDDERSGPAMEAAPATRAIIYALIAGGLALWAYNGAPPL
jgi:cytochrome b